MTHSLAWAFAVSGLKPQQVFAFQGLSSADVDYYESATVRCTNGATMVLSGAATALIGHGTRVEIFGSKGTMVYEGGENISCAVRGDAPGMPNVEIHVPGGTGTAAGTQPIGQAGLWRFVERCRGVTGPDAQNSADGVVGLRVVQALEGIYASAKTGALFVVEGSEVDGADVLAAMPAEEGN